MKNLFFSFAVVLFAGFSAFAQEAQPVNGGPQISVNKDVHDYGTIKQNANGTCEFELTNNGNEPLIISRAKGSCGCTVPEWPKEPIMPGKMKVMTVRYDTKRIGPINKSVTISSNATNNKSMVVRIKGKVIKSENKGDMPVKESSSMAPMNN
jgi:hypothetical protein